MKICGTCKYITWSCPGMMCMNENNPKFNKGSDYPCVVYLEDTACGLYEVAKMEYVVNLLSSRKSVNSYGFYRGSCYVYQGEYYPNHNRDVIDSTVKKYSSENRAKRAAESVVNKCGYVIGYEIYRLVSGIPVLVNKEV